MIGVFGASGFIGRNLVSYYESQGIRVKSFARSANGLPSDNSVIMDFKDPNSYADHLKDLTDVVLLVSASNPGTFSKDANAELVNNVLPYSQFIQSLSETNIRRVVYLSSGGAVYGVPKTEGDNGIDENHETVPISPYGLGKLLIEQLFKFHAQGSDWSYTILRPSNPVGVGQSAAKGQGLIAKAIDVGLKQETLEIWGDGSALRDYFDVNDLCSAVQTVLNLKTYSVKNKVFNVSGGNPLSVNQVVSLVEGALGHKIETSYIKNRSVDVPNINIDAARLKDVTGWSSTSDLSVVIKNMVDVRRADLNL